MINLAKLNGQPEIFYSIQGEGKNIGKPSVFVRFSLCNLYCIWCDTEYTWNWENTNYIHLNDEKPDYQKFRKDDHIIQLPNDDIVDKIKSFRCKNIVITGGEPMVQRKDLTTLLQALKAADQSFQIEIETNGTIPPTAELDDFADQYNVSVKLSNSNVKQNDRFIDKAISFHAQSPKSNFKFVVDKESDLNEILDLMTKFNISANKVYLMPQGATSTILNQKQKWVIEICKQYGFNYTDRLHIHIYGKKRGV